MYEILNILFILIGIVFLICFITFVVLLSKGNFNLALLVILLVSGVVMLLYGSINKELILKIVNSLGGKGSGNGILNETIGIGLIMFFSVAFFTLFFSFLVLINQGIYNTSLLAFSVIFLFLSGFFTIFFRKSLFEFISKNSIYFAGGFIFLIALFFILFVLLISKYGLTTQQGKTGIVFFFLFVLFLFVIFLFYFSQRTGKNNYPLFFDTLTQTTTQTEPEKIDCKKVIYTPFLFLSIVFICLLVSVSILGPKYGFSITTTEGKTNIYLLSFLLVAVILLVLYSFIIKSHITNIWNVIQCVFKTTLDGLNNSFAPTIVSAFYFLILLLFALVIPFFYYIPTYGFNTKTSGGKTDILLLTFIIVIVILIGVILFCNSTEIQKDINNNVSNIASLISSQPNSGVNLFLFLSVSVLVLILVFSGLYAKNGLSMKTTDGKNNVILLGVIAFLVFVSFVVFIINCKSVKDYGKSTIQHLNETRRVYILMLLVFFYFIFLVFAFSVGKSGFDISTTNGKINVNLLMVIIVGFLFFISYFLCNYYHYAENYFSPILSSVQTNIDKVGQTTKGISTADGTVGILFFIIFLVLIILTASNPNGVFTKNVNTGMYISFFISIIIYYFLQIDKNVLVSKATSGYTEKETKIIEQHKRRIEEITKKIEKYKKFYSKECGKVDISDDKYLRDLKNDFPLSKKCENLKNTIKNMQRELERKIPEKRQNFNALKENNELKIKIYNIRQYTLFFSLIILMVIINIIAVNPNNLYDKYPIILIIGLCFFTFLIFAVFSIFTPVIDDKDIKKSKLANEKTLYQFFKFVYNFVFSLIILVLAGLISYNISGAFSQSTSGTSTITKLSIFAFLCLLIYYLGTLTQELFTIRKDFIPKPKVQKKVEKTYFEKKYEEVIQNIGKQYSIANQYKITKKEDVFYLGKIILYILVFFVVIYILRKIGNKIYSLVFDKYYLQNGTSLLLKPVNLNTKTTIATSDVIFGSNSTNTQLYNYSISFWFFIDSYPPNTNFTYTEDTEIFNYSNNPIITYNASTNTLKIFSVNTEETTNNEEYMKELNDYIVKMNEYNNCLSKNKTTTTTTTTPSVICTKPEKIPKIPSITQTASDQTPQSMLVFEKSGIELQKWNNMVIVFSVETMDIFYNGKMLMSKTTSPNINTSLPMTCGTNNGVLGGLCNVVFFKNSIDLTKIYNLYQSMKDKEPPIPTNNFNDFMTNLISI